MIELILRALCEFSVSFVVKFYHGGHGEYTEDTKTESQPHFHLIFQNKTTSVATMNPQKILTSLPYSLLRLNEVIRL